MSVDDLPDKILVRVFAWVPCLDATWTLIMVSHRWMSVATDERAMGRRPCVVRGSRRRRSCRLPGVLPLVRSLAAAGRAAVAPFRACML